MFFNTSVLVKTACFMLVTSSLILLLQRTFTTVSFAPERALQQFTEEEMTFVHHFHTNIDKNVKYQFKERINYFDTCIEHALSQGPRLHATDYPSCDKEARFLTKQFILTHPETISLLVYEMMSRLMEGRLCFHFLIYQDVMKNEIFECGGEEKTGRDACFDCPKIWLQQQKLFKSKRHSEEEK